MSFISSIKDQFTYYKVLGEKATAGLNKEAFFYKPNSESNSIANIIQHMHGNMMSRWTDIFNTDGEKSWRNRDSEFEDRLLEIEELMALWHEGWKCLFDTIDNLSEEDLQRIIYIRNIGLTVEDALIRQLAHYPHHIGQIIYISKMLSQNWQCLSIPKSASQYYNEQKFAKEKAVKNYTDELIENLHNKKL